MNKKYVVDKQTTISPTKKRDESTGFLHVKIQTANNKNYKYFGREISDSLDADKIYNVKKPIEELKKSLTTYTDKPINSGKHLPGDGQFHVDKTHKSNQVGYMKSAEIKDNAVVVDAVITDKAVIDYLLNNSRVPVSPAYTASLSMVGNELHHKDIDINSLTILESEEARGGSSCAVLDSKNKGINMDLEKQLKEAKETNKALTDSNNALTDSKEVLLKDKISLESQVAKLTEANKLLTDSNTELTAKLEKTQQDAKANEFKIFVDSLGKIDSDITKAESIIEVKRIVLTDAKFLNKDYENMDESSVNAYFDCFKDQSKENKTTTDSSINNVNAQLNSGMKSNMNNGFTLTAEEARQIERQNNGG